MITPTPKPNDKDEDSSDLNGEIFANDYGIEERVENGNGKAKKKKKNNNEEKQLQFKPTSKIYTTYKYSNKGKGSLHEAVLLAGLPVFLKYENGQIKSVPQIEESSRIIKPPDPEEYPYEAYEFKDFDEVLSYVDRAKKESIDSLYKKAKPIVMKYNDQDDYKLVLIAANIIWSYSQDRFSTTHYVGVVGDNGSGKSTVGDTFEAIGYRPVNMTDPTAANLFRVLGTIEPGQCTIIADEAEKIDQSSDIMSTLKTGYNIKGKVARTNSNTWKQEFFWTYCFKIIIAEKSPNQNAKGVLDRTFIFNTYKGISQYDFKEVLNPSGDKTRQKLLDELLDFRKLMLIYRLLHFSDPIQDINIGVDGRDKELCKPVIQLFYSTKSQPEIEAALQTFLLQKNQRKESTIEAALCPIIANEISQYGNELSASRLWQSIKDSIDGTYDERKPNEYHTSDYGTIYRNTITNIICDKFGAKRKHKENGNFLIFDPQKVARAGKVYNTNISIQTKILPQDSPEDPEGSEGSTETPEDHQDKDDTDNEKDSNTLSKNIQNIAQNPANILKPEDNRNNSVSPKPSLPSEPSAIITTPQQSTIYRIGHTDNWACHNCKQRGDKWFMQNDSCRAQ
jgi:energy-coupling factor transporter ATP-binding protein EcfA2